MGIFSRNNGGLMDEIRCDETDYLIWKWHPRGSKKGGNRRENAIRWGSSLRVRDGSVAVFVYHQNGGSYQDFLEGPFDQIVKTSNLPVLASVVGLAYDGGTPFQAEVYFINLAQVIQIKFGVPFFDVYDPRFLDFGVPVAVRGTISFSISDYREFIRLHRLEEFDLDAFKKQVRDAVIHRVKSVVANAPTDLAIPLVQIERGISRVQEAIEPVLQERFSRDFGVTVSGVDIAAIELDKSSEGFTQLMSVTRDIEMQTVKTQSEINIKNLRDQQRINAENLEETLRIQRKEAQRAQRMSTESANFSAFQVEKQAEVGVAGAQALGQMGSHGATAMGGSAGGGFDPAAMMAGMAVGGAVGQNVAGMMNGMMGGLGTTSSQSPVQAPPLLPIGEFYVAVQGAATGPFSLDQLKAMTATGQLTQESLVWKQGMEAWSAAGSTDQVAQLFDGVSPTPPIPPIPPTA